MDELDALVRRLRGLTASGWRASRRADLVRELAVRLVRIGGAGHQLPDLPDYVLGDVVAVVGADAWAIDPDETRRLIVAASEQLS